MHYCKSTEDAADRRLIDIFNELLLGTVQIVSDTKLTIKL